ncbi:MAG: class I SAM-dependent methyltransferase [Deltaproteobacteria bacterium]
MAHDEALQYGALIRAHLAADDPFLYGTQWGDPRHGTLRYLVERYARRRKIPGDLSRVVDRYIRPYVRPSSTVLEIGSGGGRWTQFLLRARKIIVVEIVPEFCEYLEHRFGPRFEFYLTSGDEMRGVADASVDFVFSFGTLVHLPVPVVEAYVRESFRVLRPGGIAVLQYSDKTKQAAQLPGAQDAGFSATTGASFPPMCRDAGFEVLTHDLRLLNHSNIIVVRRPS